MKKWKPAIRCYLLMAQGTKLAAYLTEGQQKYLFLTGTADETWAKHQQDGVSITPEESML